MLGGYVKADGSPIDLSGKKVGVEMNKNKVEPSFKQPGYLEVLLVLIILVTAAYYSGKTVARKEIIADCREVIAELRELERSDAMAAAGLLDDLATFWETGACPTK